MFTAQKMHQVTLNNITIILTVCIIYQLINYLIIIRWQELFLLLGDKFELSHDVSALLFLIFDFLLIVLKLLILVGLIKLIGSIHKNQRQTYSMPFGNHRALLAMLFTIIFLFPSITILFTWFNGAIFSVLMGPFNFFYEEVNLANLTQLSVIILPALLILLYSAVNFAIIFFSVKNCFVREFDIISLKLIFKAVGWSYLYLLLFGLIIGIIYYILNVIIVSMNSYYQREAVLASIILINMVTIVLSIVATCILTRKAVRKYFG
ncbi:hypothetical protein RHO13_02100 [Orbus wheelerorum]|uniref:hypothetical protein n=1 Tax=Orbus wheelerorum TaxID=3074111 RepID=UPI00370D5D82